MGVKALNLKPIDGVSWEDTYGIDASALTNATASNFFVFPLGGNGSNAIAVCFYVGGSALTLSEFNNFPVGSIIFDVQAKKWHQKTAASTWVSSAAST